jgi:hypothetical protein
LTFPKYFEECDLNQASAIAGAFALINDTYIAVAAV